MNTPEIVRRIERNRTLNWNRCCDEEELMFPVKQVPLSTLTGLKDRGQQAIIRRETDGNPTVLAVAKKKYKIVSNEEVFYPVQEILANRLGTDFVKTSHLVGNGEKAFQTYIFPNSSFEVGLNDVHSLKVDVINSYDGSCALTVNVSTLRLVCLNGMTMPDKVLHYHARHSRNFDKDGMLHAVDRSITAIDSVKDRWHEWSNYIIGVDEAERILKKLPVSKSTLEALKINFEAQTKQTGWTLYSLYNVLTNWSSHYKIVNSPNPNGVVLGREMSVRTLINNEPLFQTGIAA